MRIINCFLRINILDQYSIDIIIDKLSISYTDITQQQYKINLFFVFHINENNSIDLSSIAYFYLLIFNLYNIYLCYILYHLISID